LIAARRAPPRSLAMRWHLVHPQDIAVLRFDDEALVFNPATWETHLLNESASLVLGTLLEGPRSVDDIVATVTRVSDAAVPDGFPEQVVDLLGQLESLGLVSASA
jgi:PqqD family protein of HPr-rel-A system